MFINYNIIFLLIYRLFKGFEEKKIFVNWIVLLNFNHWRPCLKLKRLTTLSQWFFFFCKMQSWYSFATLKSVKITKPEWKSWLSIRIGIAEKYMFITYMSCLNCCNGSWMRKVKVCKKILKRHKLSSKIVPFMWFVI